MKQLIFFIEQQIQTTEEFVAHREAGITERETLIAGDPLVQESIDYLQELKEALPLLKYLSAPVPQWNEVIDGSINVPDDLDKLVNSIGFQIRFHTISGKGEAETVCSIAAIAQKFFHQYRPKL